MQYPVQTLFILLTLLLSACANTGVTTDSDEDQALVIERWNRCLDNSFIRLANANTSLKRSVKNTLVVCQGHREDVLATFPRRLHRQLRTVTEEQAYRAGLNQRIGDQVLDPGASALSQALLPNL